MKNVPETSYKYDSEKLAKYYKKAALNIKKELENTDYTNYSAIIQAAQLEQITKILNELEANTASWVRRNIPKAAREGVAVALYADLVGVSLEEARKIARFSTINESMVEALVADTFEDLFAVSRTMERRVKTALRSAVAESMRMNWASGVNGTRTNTRDIANKLREKLGESVETGLVDAGGRRWKPDVYAEMIARTKMVQAQLEATTNEALGRGVQYATISQHGAKDACSSWEGKIVKLVADAEGDYPTLEAARSSRQIFHPNCKHVIVPLRDPSRLDRRKDAPKVTSSPPPINHTTKQKGEIPRTFSDKVKGAISTGVKTEAHAREVGTIVAEEIKNTMPDELKELRQNYRDLGKKIDTLHQGLIKSNKNKNYPSNYRDMYNDYVRLKAEREKLIEPLQYAKMAHVSKVLSEIRPVGVSGGLNFASRAAGTKPAIVKQGLNEVAKHLPTDWLETSNKGKLAVGVTKRGYYSGSFNDDGQLLVSGESMVDILRVAFHEMGHRFEHMNKDIVKLEKEFYKRRTQGESLVHMGAGYDKSELTRVDNFLHKYMGKDYSINQDGDSRYYELLSMGLEWLYTDREQLSKDPDFEAFILGVLASL